MSVNQAGEVRPKPRRQHFAAQDAAKLKQEFSHLYNGEGASQTTNNTMTNVILNPPPSLPNDPPTEPKVDAQPPANNAAVTTAPVIDVPLPENYEDLLGKAMAGDITKPEPKVEPNDSKEDEFRRKNEELLRELEDTRKQLEEARKIPDNLRALHDEQELENLLKNSGVDFRSIDMDDAKKLLAPVIQTMRQQQSASNAEFQRKLAEQEETLKSRFKELDDREHYSKLEKTKAAILAAHPDLEQLQKTPEYQRTMASPIGGKSGVLIGQLVAAEYRQGNAEYIIDVLNRIKAGVQTDLSDVASVSPASTTTAPSAAGSDKSGRLTPEELAELRFKVQSRQISRQEFREIMEKHREAQR